MSNTVISIKKVQSNGSSIEKINPMKTAIGIKRKHTLAIAHVLSKILADEYVLSTKTRNAHWNIIGPDFYDKHKFFETQIDQIDAFIDDVAERIRMIGHYAPATLKLFLELTQLTEMTREKNNSQGFIKELLADHEAIIITLRENIRPFSTEFGDLGSGDFITGLMEAHEKMAWFLRSHLQV